ncbi:MAG: hypothetical protein HUU29_08090 [Planctomycetaceae bacterium]|nr:hypothetical protein [Planctomycetaceae bacterium]
MRKYDYDCGFWGIEGDDGVRYCIMNDEVLDPAFQRAGLRVSFLWRSRRVRGLHGDQGIFGTAECGWWTRIQLVRVTLHE